MKEPNVHIIRSHQRGKNKGKKTCEEIKARNSLHLIKTKNYTDQEAQPKLKRRSMKKTTTGISND